MSEVLEVARDMYLWRGEGVPEEETGRTVRHNKRDIVPNCVIEVIIQVLSKTNNFLFHRK